MKHITQSLKVIALATVLSFGLSYVYAWTAPTVNPPAGNVEAPINTSTTSQYKNGALGIGGIIHGYSNAIFDGNVGVGTVNPKRQFVVSSSSAPLIGLETTSNGLGWFMYADNASPSVFHIGNYTNSGWTMANYPFNINSNGNVGIGTTWPGWWAALGSYPVLEVNGTLGVSGNDNGSGLSSISSEGGGLPLRLKARAGDYPDLVVGTNGNVGIGTAGASAKLQIQSNFSGGGPTIVLKNQDPNGHTAIDFKDNNNTLKGNIAWRPDYNAFVINEKNTNTLLNSNGGNVGIGGGTTNPVAKLDVNGDISFNGQKFCASVTPGSYVASILVPRGWTTTSCDSWRGMTGYTSYFIGCIFSSSFSRGTDGGGTPSPNCGW